MKQNHDNQTLLLMSDGARFLIPSSPILFSPISSVIRLWKTKATFF